MRCSGRRTLDTGRRLVTWSHLLCVEKATAASLTVHRIHTRLPDQSHSYEAEAFQSPRCPQLSKSKENPLVVRTPLMRPYVRALCFPNRCFPDWPSNDLHAARMPRAGLPWRHVFERRRMFLLTLGRISCKICSSEVRLTRGRLKYGCFTSIASAKHNCRCLKERPTPLYTRTITHARIDYCRALIALRGSMFPEAVPELTSSVPTTWLPAAHCCSCLSDRLCSLAQRGLTLGNLEALAPCVL